VNNEPTFNPKQSEALKQTRQRWAIALLVNLPLPFIALPLVGSDWLEQEPNSVAGRAMMLAVVIGVAALIVGHMARNQAYKSDWKGNVIGPDGYRLGNTYFFAALSAGALGLFVLSITGGWPAPTFTAAPIVIGLLIFNFPNGRPMQPAPPRLLDGDGL
jgi:vacuolar-type H+-ATPase subunit I/STV1